MYKTALQNHFTYNSTVGAISTEELFELPLTGNKGLNLDKIAKTLDNEIKTQGTSFVSAVPADKIPTQKLELVKDVIATKLAEQAALKTAAENKTKREKILQILASKQDEVLSSKTEAELLAELEALG